MLRNRLGDANSQLRTPSRREQIQADGQDNLDIAYCIFLQRVVTILSLPGIHAGSLPRVFRARVC